MKSTARPRTNNSCGKNKSGTLDLMNKWLNCNEDDVDAYLKYCDYCGTSESVIAKIIELLELNTEGFPLPIEGFTHSFVVFMEHLVRAAVIPVPIETRTVTRSATKLKDAKQRAFDNTGVEFCSGDRSSVQASCNATCKGGVTRLFDLAKVNEPNPFKAAKAIAVIRNFCAKFCITLTEYNELELHHLCDYAVLRGAV